MYRFPKAWLSLLCSSCVFLQLIGRSHAARCGAGTSQYDFIIVGGGTGGLAVATRLNQRLPAQCILVIEAGGDGSSEPKITIPGNRGTAFGSAYDWNFTTVPQPGENGRIINHPRGHALGGSSAINFMTWDRASKDEYDAWEELGSPGWNWKSLRPAMLAAETFNRTFLGPGQYGEDGVGYTGPVNTFINEQVPIQQQTFIPTLEALGIKQNLESLGGNPLGVMYQPTNVLRSNYTRSYSITYLALANENLIVRANTIVERLDIDKKTSKVVGVILSNGDKIKAAKEVILSAGAFQTPQLLELSGIGDKSVLSAAGIQQIVDLPGVGKNLQDHIRVSCVLELKPQYTSLDVIRFNSTRAALELELYRQGRPSIYRYTGSSYAFATWQQVFGSNNTLPQIAKTVATNNIIDQKKLSYLLDRKRSQRIPQLELIFTDGYTGVGPYPPPSAPGHGKQFFTIIGGIMHPFARGTVHINPADPTGPPIIDPRYLSNKYDVEAIKLTAKYLRRVANTAPFRDVWISEFSPGETVQTDEQWENFVRDTTSTIYHPVGTAAMLPRRDGGVVDPELKVYGVKGLRVVDASILPIIVSAHTQTAVYGIAERAAELIAKSWVGNV